MKVIINEFINDPKTNTPVAFIPKANPESPNTANIAAIIAVTTAAITTVIIIKPK